MSAVGRRRLAQHDRHFGRYSLIKRVTTLMPGVRSVCNFVGVPILRSIASRRTVRCKNERGPWSVHNFKQPDSRILAARDASEVCQNYSPLDIEGEAERRKAHL